MKFDLNKEMKPWLEIFNNNFKWSIALIIRISISLLLFLLIILFMKWSGIIKNIKEVINDLSNMEIQPEKPVRRSKPSTPTHRRELKRSQELRELIKDRINKSKDGK